jgi:hypothetical protein
MTTVASPWNDGEPKRFLASLGMTGKAAARGHSSPSVQPPLSVIPVTLRSLPTLRHPVRGSARVRSERSLVVPLGSGHDDKGGTRETPSPSFRAQRGISPRCPWEASSRTPPPSSFCARSPVNPNLSHVVPFAMRGSAQRGISERALRPQRSAIRMHGCLTADG